MSGLGNAARAACWVVIEASLAIISACLPTLRPIFRGLSLETVVRSVRSVLSIIPPRKNGSKSYGSANLEQGGRKDSDSSTAGINHSHMAPEESGFDNRVTGSCPETLDSMPSDGVMAHRSFTMAERRSVIMAEEIQMTERNV